MKAVPSMVSGFDYFGAGNIGDDLMFAGLLDALDELRTADPVRLYGFSDWDIEALRHRFPRVRWASRTPAELTSSQETWPRDCWAAVGDTPLQYAVGDWLLKYWTEELPYIRKFRRKVMINIGAESEIAPRAADFARICNEYDRISTRDRHTHEIVTQTLGVPLEKVRLASDLAHVALKKIFPVASAKTERFGIIVAGDTLAPVDLRCLKQYVETRPDRSVFLANINNPKVSNDVTLYRELCGSWWPWTRFRRRTHLWTPPYATGSMADQVQGIAGCETVFSSRYHGILVAAWAGCRVAAIGRSSKVTALAEELGIGCCQRPFTQRSMDAALEGAIVVPRERLERLASLALEGVKFALEETA